jgi:hypothetical protein
VQKPYLDDLDEQQRERKEAGDPPGLTKLEPEVEASGLSDDVSRTHSSEKGGPNAQA